MQGTVDVCSGKHCSVVMTTAVEEQFCRVDAKQRARCLEWMKRFASDGPRLLDKQKFRHEGRFPVGDKKGTQVAIYAFKAWQLRLYGGMVGGVFVITEIDIKKDDAADQGKLRAAAKKLLPYVAEESGGGKR